MNHTLTTLSFNGIDLTVIELDGVRWLTAEQIGRCLGYAEANARQGIIGLHHRHADEFTEQDTRVIKLITQGGFDVKSTSNLGGNPNTRIFSPTGSNLLGFFANTPRAKDFRVWAKNVLANQPVVVAPVAAVPVQQPSDRLTDCVEVLTEQMCEMAGHMGKMAAGVDVVLTQMNVTGRYIAMLEMNQRGHVKVTPEVRDQAQLMLAQGVPMASIARLLRISNTTVWNIKHDKYPVTKRLQEASDPQVADVLAQMIESRRTAILASGRTL